MEFGVGAADGDADDTLAGGWDHQFGRQDGGGAVGEAEAF